MSRVSILKAGEKTWSGRIYTPESIKDALTKIRWDQCVPLSGIDRNKEKKQIGFIKRSEIEYDEASKTLYVTISEDYKLKIMGLSLAPIILVIRSGRDKESLTVTEFSFEGVEATSDLCAFSSIDCTVK